MIELIINDIYEAPEPISINFNQPSRSIRSTASSLELNLTEPVTRFAFNGTNFKVTRSSRRYYTIEVSDQLIPQLSAGTILWSGNELHNQLLFGEKYFDLNIVGVTPCDFGSLVVTQL